MTDNNLEDAQYADEGIELPDPDVVPDQIREHVLQPIPGSGYVLQFPPKAGFACSEINRIENEKPVKRLGVSFGIGDGEPLTIVGVPGGDCYKEFLHTQFKFSINNHAWNKLRKVSEMYYLLKATGNTPVSGWKNEDYKQAMLKLAGKKFSATIEWRAQCKNNRVRWINVDGHPTADPSGAFGCGKSTYHKTIARYVENGMWPEYVTCPCGAVIRCFAELTGFKAL